MLTLKKFAILVLISTIGAKYFLVETEGQSLDISRLSEGKERRKETGSDYSDSRNSEDTSRVLSLVEICRDNVL